MKEIKLYTWRTCPFCHKAKQLLNNNGYEFTEIDIQDTPEVKQALTEKFGQHTVPYVFVEDELIGGSSDLEELLISGEFESKLQ